MALQELADTRKTIISNYDEALQKRNRLIDDLNGQIPRHLP